MIQRIQSFYLLLTSIFYFLYWFFGHKWYAEGYVFFKQKIINNVDASLFQFLFDLTSAIPLIISLLSFFTIFMFNKRLIQIKLISVSFYLSVFMLLYSLLYFSFTLFYLLNIISSSITEILLYAAIINPVICCYLLYSAINRIRHDEGLVNSINRIR